MVAHGGSTVYSYERCIVYLIIFKVFGIILGVLVSSLSSGFLPMSAKGFIHNNYEEKQVLSALDKNMFRAKVACSRRSDSGERREVREREK